MKIDQLLTEAEDLFGKGSVLARVVKKPVNDQLWDEIRQLTEVAVLKKEQELTEYRAQVKNWYSELRLAKYTERRLLKDTVREFYGNLSPSQKMLVTLRDELYDGSWSVMQEDLEARLNGKPYIFKLVNRTEEDIKNINMLKEYEENNKVNLKDYVN